MSPPAEIGRPGPLRIRVLSGFDFPRRKVATQPDTGLPRDLMRYLIFGQRDPTRRHVRMGVTQLSAALDKSSIKIRQAAVRWTTTLGVPLIENQHLRLPSHVTSDLWEWEDTRRQARAALTQQDAIDALARAESVYAASEEAERRRPSHLRYGEDPPTLRRAVSDVAVGRHEDRRTWAVLHMLARKDLAPVAYRLSQWLREPGSDAKMTIVWQSWELLEALVYRLELSATTLDRSPLPVKDADVATHWAKSYLAPDNLRDAVSDFACHRTNLNRSDPEGVMGPLRQSWKRTEGRSLLEEELEPPGLAEIDPPQAPAEPILEGRSLSYLRKAFGEDVIRSSRENLRPPLPVGRIVGRGLLMSALGDRMQRAAFPFAVWGGAGVGKTELMAHVVQPMVEDVLWLMLLPRQSPTIDDVSRHMLRALGERIPADATRIEHTERLRRRMDADEARRVIVIDNADDSHVQLIRDLIDQVSSRVVIISRLALDIPADSELVVPPIESSDAEDLLNEQSAHAGGAAVTEEWRVRICEAVGQHPFAIRLVARSIARSGVSAEDAVSELEARQVEVKRDSYRDHDIRAGFEFARSHLDNACSTVFNALGTHASSGALESGLASAVASEDIAGALEELEQRGLVDPDGVRRWRTHPLLHEQARRVAGREEFRGMISFWVRYARANQDDLARLESERDNLFTAVEEAWQRSEWAAVHELCIALEGWLDRIGDWKRLLQLLDRAHQASLELENRTAELARVLILRATLRGTVGHPGARADAERGLQYARTQADERLLIDALVSSSALTPDRDDERSLLDEAWRRSCDTAPDYDEMSYIAYQMAHLEEAANDREAAKDWLYRCRELAAKHGRTDYDSYALTSLGRILWAEAVATQDDKKRRDALTNMEHALLLKEKLGDRHSIAISRECLGDFLADDDGMYASAIDHYRVAEDIYTSLGLTEQTLRVHCAQIRRHRRAGEHALALQAADRASALVCEQDTAVRAKALRVIGGTWEAAEAWAEALVAYREALAVMRSATDVDHMLMAATLHDIGDVHRKAGQMAEAAAAYRAAVEHKRQGDDGQGLATCLYWLGRALEEAGDLEQALSVYEEARALLEGLPEPPQRTIGVVWHDIGDVHRKAGQMAEAAAAYSAAVEHKRQGEKDPGDLAAGLHALGRALEKAGDLEQALSVYEEARALLEGLPEPPQRTIGVVWFDIGDVHRLAGRTAEAAAAYHVAVEHKRRSEKDPEDLAVSLYALGWALEEAGDLKEALAVYEEARTLLEGLPEPPQQTIGVLLHEIGRVLAALGRTKQAERLCRDSVAIARRGADADGADAEVQRDLSISYSILGDVLVVLGGMEEAERLHRDAVYIAQRLAEHDPEDVDGQRLLSVIHSKLGDVLFALGTDGEAEQQYRADRAIAERLVETVAPRPADERGLGVSRRKLGALLVRLGRTSEAEPLLAAAVGAAESTAGGDSDTLDALYDLGIARSAMGELLVALGRTGEAERVLRDAVAVAEQLTAQNAEGARALRLLCTSRRQLGELLVTLGDLDGAEPLLRDSAALGARIVETDPDDTVARRELGVSQRALGELLAVLGDTTAAERLLGESVATGQHAVEAAPGNAVARSQLGESRLALDRLRQSA